VKEILRDNPTLDVNWKNDQFFGCTALHLACTKGFEAIVAILLAHPGIDVNEKAIHGATPFFWGCTGGHVSCFRLMLKDPRVLVNKPDNFGNTPLKNAVWWKNPDVIKWWVASGREMDLGEPGNGATDAIGGARKFNLREVLALLERFQENPAETIRQVRVELGFLEEMAAEVFALVVFLSDGLLQICQAEKVVTSPAARFFSISKRLPLELQMVLCRRVVGSSEEVITGQVSEAAFKNLAKIVKNS